MALSYAPYQSRFNPIEHAWSPRSNDLTGLRLSATLEAPPSLQSGLSEDDILRKEAVIRDLAIVTVAKHWEGKKHDEFNVTPVVLESLSPSRDVTFERYEQICKFTTARVQALDADVRLKEMKAEYKLLARHCDHRNNFLAFTKCDNSECHHCSKFGVQSKKSMALIRKCGGHFFTPTPDSNRPGHYRSYLDMLLCLVIFVEKPAAPDHFLSMDGKAPERCSKCRYVFTSIADGTRHKQLAHGSSTAKASGQHVCTFSSETDGSVAYISDPTMLC